MLPVAAAVSSDESFNAIFAWLGKQVAWGSLKHGNMRRFLSQGRYKSDSSSAGANDHNVLVRVVKVLRPELRVHYCSFVVVNPWDGGLERLFVVVVAGAKEKEFAAEGLLFSLVCSYIESPSLVLRRVVCTVDMVVEFDLLVDAILLRGLAQVLGDERAFGNRGVFFPWPPWEPESVEV